MDRKIIFFDIDGTISTEDTRFIPESTIQAIKEARLNGHLTYINTGRTYINIGNDLKDLGFDGYVCGCGTYIRVGDKVLLSKTIEKNTCKEIIQKLRECKIEAILEGQVDVYFDKTVKNKRLNKVKDYFESIGLGVRDDWDSEGIQFDKLFIVSNEETNLNEFKQYIEKDFDYIDRGNNQGEIVPKGYTKASGIKFLLDYYNIPFENAYAIGDSSNDLSMLEYVQNSIAMGNSDPCIYEIASFRTKDILEDGIWHALKHFHII